MTDFTPIYYNGKVVGKVRDGVFMKSVHSSRHFLRYPPAITFNTTTLDQAETAGAVMVQVTDKDTGVVYRASLARIRERGFSLDRGHGEQIALPLESWMVTKRGGGLQLALSLGVQDGR